MSHSHVVYQTHYKRLPLEGSGGVRWGRLVCLGCTAVKYNTNRQTGEREDKREEWYARYRPVWVLQNCFLSIALIIVLYWGNNTRCTVYQRVTNWYYSRYIHSEQHRAAGIFSMKQQSRRTDWKKKRQRTHVIANTQEQYHYLLISFIIKQRGTANSECRCRYIQQQYLIRGMILILCSPYCSLGTLDQRKHHYEYVVLILIVDSDSLDWRYRYLFTYSIVVPGRESTPVPSSLRSIQSNLLVDKPYTSING